MILATSIFAYKILFSTVNQNTIENDLQKYKEDIITINNYLIDLSDKQVYISSENSVYLKNEQVAKSFVSLKQKGYKVITKNNNAISYLKWSKLDEGRGLVYSIDGEKPQLQFLTEIEALSEDKWYYYEEDFNEWRKKAQ